MNLDDILKIFLLKRDLMIPLINMLQIKKCSNQVTEDELKSLN